VNRKRIVKAVKNSIDNWTIEQGHEFKVLVTNSLKFALKISKEGLQDWQLDGYKMLDKFAKKYSLDFEFFDTFVFDDTVLEKIIVQEKIDETFSDKLRKGRLTSQDISRFTQAYKEILKRGLVDQDYKFANIAYKRNQIKNIDPTHVCQLPTIESLDDINAKHQQYLKIRGQRMYATALLLRVMGNDRLANQYIEETDCHFATDFSSISVDDFEYMKRNVDDKSRQRAKDMMNFDLDSLSSAYMHELYSAQRRHPTSVFLADLVLQTCYGAEIIKTASKELKFYRVK